MANSIVSAVFTDFSTVKVRTKRKVTDKSVFTVRDQDGTTLPVLAPHRKKRACAEAFECSTAVGKTEFDIKLDCEIDIQKTYTVADESGIFDPAPIRLYKLFGTRTFDDKYYYDGPLGALCSKTRTAFVVWSPVAKSVTLNVYETASGAEKTEYKMTRGARGEYGAIIDGNLSGKYYTYTVVTLGTAKEVVDPYAVSLNADGKRGMIIDITTLNPDGWNEQSRPTLKAYTDAVVYEAHLRDLTIHESSNVTPENRGKYMGLTERGTHDRPTALDRISELGVTAVHFQPLYDFGSVKEDFSRATFDRRGEYNWGYDPLNYNAPEGSYSSDPNDGTTRVIEMKQMIAALHNAGICVVMDVVYNHVFDAASSNFEALVPDYYFRMTTGGDYSDGSACGNETASDHAMFRRFMIDSVVHWARDYRIDGFRFDLMGLHDVDTMNAVYAALSAVNPHTVVYGEGWTAGACGLDEGMQAVKSNAEKMPNIAFFNDIIRDGLKGSVFEPKDTGFVNGSHKCAAVYVGAAGGTDAVGEDMYRAVNDGAKAFAASPIQSVNYVSAHDNATLWDKLNASVNADTDTLKAMNRLAAVSVFTSQGMAFILAGEEMQRSKPAPREHENECVAYMTAPDYYFSENSYRSPDSVNAIDWTLADKNTDTVGFYKALIGIKKSFAQFAITNTDKLKFCLVIKDTDLVDGVAAYAVKDPESDEYAVLAFNATDRAVRVSVPKGEYKVYVNGDSATADKAAPLSVFYGDTITVAPLSAIVMTGELDRRAVDEWSYSVSHGKSAKASEGDFSAAKRLGIELPDTVVIK